MTKRPIEYEEMLTPAEVAAALRVDPKTLVIWANKGKIEHIRTPGGHRRYPRTGVEKFLRTRIPKP